MLKVFYTESFLGLEEKRRKVRERWGAANCGDSVDRCQRNASKKPNKSYQIDAALVL